MESKVHELDGLKGERNYRGCLVTKLIGVGYSIWGLQVSSPQEVDEAIDNAGTILAESIDRGGVTVKEGFSCVNDKNLDNVG